MSKLVLDSLEVKNFRAFKHLRIEKLGRVNLIVGKNNVGKSSVLETLWLYGRRGDPAVIWDILGSRAERSTSLSQEAVIAEDKLEALKYLFHGRQDIREYEGPILIGAINPLKPHFFIDVGWFLFQPGENGNTNLKRVLPKELQAGNTSFPALVVGVGDRVIYTLPLASEMRWTSPIGKEDRGPVTVLVSAKGLSKTQVGQLWDDIALTDLETDVVAALRIVSSGVERASLVSEKGPYAQRNPIVKLRGDKTPIPLGSMGEGMNRMFGIALALVNAKGGMLLIDEVDTGLHYSMLSDLWKLILEVAHRLNVQVFATSHSWDCIQAFQYAAEANKEEEGMLIRLENRKAGVGAVTFDEEELSVVAREHIEVR